MREYQSYGYKWMKTISSYGFGGILADDMGLGKTLQAIALMLDAKQHSEKHIVNLVVCPSSLSLNWESEISKFAPELKTLTIIGTASERSKKIEQIPKHDVVITSYSLISRDLADYEKYEFYYHFIDEAQYIKNNATQMAKAVKSVNSLHRFALTGTPVENSLAELWSIFDFIMPDYLYGYQYFKNTFETPVVKEKSAKATESLQRIVSPFILRRLKSDVLTELPEKTETVLLTDMEDEQSKVYSANVASVRAAVSQSDGDSSERIKILAMLTRLRQLCCDPSLVYDNYKGKSAKLEQCMELIGSCIDSGHKILLFSQFTSMLDIIQSRLDEADISFYTLTGATKPAQRIKMVNSFNSDDTKVFLISLKAGGTGLNLTGADIVIHYDPWWNISAENQASDRAYRIGQKKNVQIYKMITRHTIEEKIRELQLSKSELADIALGGGTSENSIMRMSSEEILKLLE
ncbi:MAG: DEAD/DEAH box helicase [Oscillospiraceae bacterium]